VSSEYTNNHYVPEWYQKRFLVPGSHKLFYLDFSPPSFRDAKGGVHFAKEVKLRGPRSCFCEDNLYTVQLGSLSSTEIEQLFFGEIDRRGRFGVSHFANFRHGAAGASEAFLSLVRYMSAQKLRTPKGLALLRETIKSNERNEILGGMIALRDLFCATWTECIWLIADASRSATKFIISDHPVTVYNRRCGPRSQWCKDFKDPEIWLNATQTIFPLSLDKILILTNLSWVRNPYQNPVALRPNPNPLRNAMFQLLAIQVERHLTEQEVREINFIIKARALRFLAAGKEEWLYPDQHVSKADWANYGKGYLLMPDPRSVSFTSEVLIGFKGGTSTGFDAYGRRPWERDYRVPGGSDEWHRFNKFRKEFAKKFGPYRRGRSFQINGLDEEKDSDDLHKSFLNYGKRH
jgi:hypothetical protein